MNQNMDKLKFDDPYRSVEEMSSKMRSALENELLTEITQSHVLFDCQWTVIGRRMDNDDVLIKLSTGEIAVVHLTWSRKPGYEHLPRTAIFRDPNDFWEKEMNLVISDYMK